ncbi:hypothetical protein GM661_16900 [Iocasia frigidifontis]|uniref:Nucleoid-associated protein n=1 Tax=Iocasia fonsfrigidae TaxID=2682810 RepID=A0A8A7KI90_9FIRM|nr:YbaB/EbfC family nucleoid-associated protein [Iocasia fonsfrigidae]MTI61439.1 YbaB/EbfC family nucleoid-associated protein [Bacillota bacterium]QTL99508.1 hypothetical protein GM661_16900 [Iocasia fonsfrigidae]
MNNMDDIMGQIAVIKQRMNQLQEELKKTKVNGSDDDKIITVIVSGSGQVIDYEFDLKKIEIFDQEKLIKSLIEATNRGLTAARELEAKKKKEIVGTVDIPNIPGLF